MKRGDIPTYIINRVYLHILLQIGALKWPLLLLFVSKELRVHTQSTRKSSATLSSRRRSTTFRALFSSSNFSLNFSFSTSRLWQVQTHTSDHLFSCITALFECMQWSFSLTFKQVQHPRVKTPVPTFLLLLQRSVPWLVSHLPHREQRGYSASND